MNKKLIFLELNEINFDTVSHYLERGDSFPGFKKIFEKGIINTVSESEYKNLEPWIQWPSVHTGKTFDDHKIFRLGDFVHSNDEQFFEKVEKAGFYVGAVSPMNATNRLKNPAYFIPDPWTKTDSDGSFLSKTITDAIVQAVNDNSKSKLKLKTIFSLIIAFIFMVNPNQYLKLIKYALNSLGKSWRKALFLDMFLFEIHKSLLNRKNPNFSTLFLNAGAHIQHHYYFNSPFGNLTKLKNPTWYIDKNYDPIKEMLKVYDQMLLNLIEIPNTAVIIATGLSQKPYENLKFYYRLKDHSLFLKKIGISFKSVAPRMTRDFLISFDSFEQAKKAEIQLSEILVNNKIKLFKEIDNRGKDIFVVLTYPHEITNTTSISYLNNKILLKDLVTFVAIKNGEHQSKGFVYFSDNLKQYAPPEGSHVSKIHNTVLQYFGIPE